MEGNKSQHRALLIFGAPCSGKTTFCEKFAKKYNLVYFNLGQIVDEHHLSRKNLAALIEQLTKTERDFIFEGCIDTVRDREEISRILKIAGYKPATIWIQTDLSTIRARLKAKYSSIAEAKQVYDSIVPTLEAPSEIEFPIILSGKHTFETQSKHVLAGLA